MVGAFLRVVEQRLRGRGVRRLLSFLDGKPLPVSRVSKDPDARHGRGAGGLAKGYKLHTLWSTRPLPEAREVRPLHEAELVVNPERRGRFEPRVRKRRPKQFPGMKKPRAVLRQARKQKRPAA